MFVMLLYDWGDTFMHGKHVRNREIPYGYTFMHGKLVQIRERSIKG